METLISYFGKAGFNAEDSHKITSGFVLTVFKKGAFFIKEGEVAKQIGFVESGLWQYYSLTQKEEECTTYISLPGTFVTSLSSYITETPARENIRNLTDSKLWLIEKQTVEWLKKEVSGFKDFYIQLLEWQVCCIDKAKMDLITLTAEQRYDKLLKEEPELLQQVPLQYLASMLGVTPRHLSRLRQKI